MKKHLYILIAFFSLQSCQTKSENKSRLPPSQTIEKSDTLDSREETVESQEYEIVNRDSINDFLNKPFDLFECKNKTSANSSRGQKKEYYLKPNKKGMYYEYFLFSELRGYMGTNKDRVIRREGEK